MPTRWPDGSGPGTWAQHHGRNAHTPFGGFKMSGMGRMDGKLGMHTYSELQSIVWPS